MATSTTCSRTFHRKLESRFRNVFVPFEEGPDKAIRPFIVAGRRRELFLAVSARQLIADQRAARRYKLA
jgi:hypothetical protein